MTEPFKFTFTILGEPCSWKNSRRIVTKPFPKSLPSKKAERWMKSAVKQLEDQWEYASIPKTTEVNAAIVSYLKTPRFNDMHEIHGWTNDADSLYGGPGDALQAAGVIEDDVCIASHDGSRRRHDKENPRVEITLTRVDGERDEKA